MTDDELLAFGKPILRRLAARRGFGGGWAVHEALKGFVTSLADASGES